VLVKDIAGNNGFVLIRALEPTRGIEQMQQRRISKSKAEFSLRDLCSGPGKLTQALGVRGVEHGRDLGAGDSAEMIGFLPRKKPLEIVADIRIGISKAAHLPWRFLLKDSLFVSVRATESAVAAAKAKFHPQQSVKQPKGKRKT
jgi:DNA-3-methyladenine glycosylase